MENTYKVGQLLETKRDIVIFVEERNGVTFNGYIEYPQGSMFEIVEVVLRKHDVSYSINFLMDKEDIIYSFSESEIDSLTFDNEIEIITKNGISDKFIDDICKHFDISIVDFSESLKLGKIKVFKDFREFFDWYFNLNNKEELIQTLWEVYNNVKQVKNIVDERDFIQLKDDTVVFMF